MDRTPITDTQGCWPAVGDARALVARSTGAAQWPAMGTYRMRDLAVDAVHPFFTKVTKRHNGISVQRPLEVST